MIEVCSDGGIGIRTGLKILGPQGIEGLEHHAHYVVLRS